MNITREIAHSADSCPLCEDCARLLNGCLGCADCPGQCPAIREMLTLPDLILKEKAA